MKISHLSLLTICSLISVNVFALNSGINGHVKGDVIGVKSDDQIAAWCDFNKQIVLAQFNTLCVYNGNNPSSSSTL